MMRVNTEQLKQILQTIGSRQKRIGGGEGEAEFQDMITQILSMMNMPPGGFQQHTQENQTVQISQVRSVDLDTIGLPVNQHAILVQGDILADAMYHHTGLLQDDTQSLVSVFKEAVGAEVEAGIKAETLLQGAVEMAQEYMEHEQVSMDSINGSIEYNMIAGNNEGAKNSIEYGISDSLEDSHVDIGNKIASGNIDSIRQDNMGGSQVSTPVPNPESNMLFSLAADGSREYEALLDSQDDGRLDKSMADTDLRLSTLSGAKSNTTKEIQLEGSQRENPFWHNDSPLDSDEAEVVEQIGGHILEQRALPERTTLSRTSTDTARIQNLQDITMQVADRVKLLKEGDHSSLQIKLKPEELGQVEILVSMKDGQLRGQILVDTISTAEAIESQLQTLKERLKDQNILLNEVNVSLHQNDLGSGREGSRSLYQDGGHAHRFSGRAVGGEDPISHRQVSQLPINPYSTLGIGSSLDFLA